MQRAVKAIVAKPRTLQPCGLDQSVPKGHQIATLSRCPRAGEMVERPDYAGRTHVEAGVTILGTLILWVCWPKACLIQPGVCVVDDFLNGRLGRGRLPSSGIYGNVPFRIDHACAPRDGHPSATNGSPIKSDSVAQHFRHSETSRVAAEGGTSGANRSELG